MPVIHRIFATILWALIVESTYAAQDVKGNPVLKLGDAAPIDSPGTYYSDLHPCPTACLDNKPENRTVHSTLERLQHCGEAMLFDLALYNPVDSPVGSAKLRTCTAGTPRDANTTVNAPYIAVTSEEQTYFSLVLGQRGAKVSQVDGAVSALEYLQEFMAEDSNCDVPVALGYSNRTVVGMYLGATFGRDTASSAIERLVKHAQENGFAETTVVQLYSDSRNANHVLGVAISPLGDVAVVQKLLAAWSQADCPSEFDQTFTWEDVPGSESDAGQWDAGNQWAAEGLNLTETTYALSMITKAGVPTNKIFVGESSYGQSFMISEKCCTGLYCFFEEDWLNSPAAKGKCTDTGGYMSNAEIDDILILNHNT
ncbi:hypothetical protein BJY01DRAFT_252754 [Aspergillus pseudoustus]|uniref:Uncharacterized protein n=1 Tax=Aspergillus pseudoustus TaxID=1810923 RepID=A0ABR4J8C6_9EURO